MPVRSSRSSVMRWPDAETVHQAALAWARALVQAWPGIVAAGYFGSYARGEAGVGSDLDLVVILRDSDLPFERRAVAWDIETLPTPAEVVAYTVDEWRRLPERSPRFARTLARETVWLVGAPPVNPADDPPPTHAP